MNSENQIVAAGGIGALSAIEDRLQAQQKRLDVINEFCAKNLVQGLHYGNSFAGAQKPSLLKPGAEHVLMMFGCHAKFERDCDVWEMLGKPSNIICLVCRIYANDTGIVVGEGRGAERVGAKSRDENSTIKIAEKRALIDAVLYTFALSGKFTQDMEGAATLAEMKRSLVEFVTELRAGVKNGIANNKWIVKVCRQVLHKGTISTIREFELVEKAVKSGIYNLSTGEEEVHDGRGKGN